MQISSKKQGTSGRSKETGNGRANYQSQIEEDKQREVFIETHRVIYAAREREGKVVKERGAGEMNKGEKTYRQTDRQTETDRQTDRPVIKNRASQRTVENGRKRNDKKKKKKKKTK